MAQMAFGLPDHDPAGQGEQLPSTATAPSPVVGTPRSQAAWSLPDRYGLWTMSCGLVTVLFTSAS